MTLVRAPLLLAAVLALTACDSSPLAAPPDASSSGASAVASPASSTSATRAASPVSSAAASAGSAAPASAAASPSALAGVVKLTLGSDDSQMSITMHELLAGNAAQTNAVESSKAVSGTIMLDAQANVLPGSKVSLDLRTLQSDRQIRDNFIKRVTLQTNQFPNVDFTPKQVQGLDSAIPASGEHTFKLVGDATVKGVTHTMTWDVTATFTGQGCQGTATAPLMLSDFGLTPPKAGPVISVEDTGTISLKFQATKAAA